MEAFIYALFRAIEHASFEEVSRIHARCHTRDPRPPSGERSGSTRLADCNFLYLLVRWLRPSVVFEVGTLIGTSASAMSLALLENGDGGVLYTVDSSYAGFEPIEGHPVRCFAKQRSDVALKALREEGRRIDFAFIDGTIDRRDVELLNVLMSSRSVIALHDYKPPADKGITNAWLLARHLDGVSHCVWILPERQGIGYQPVEGVFVNSSVAVLLPEGIAQSLQAAAVTAR
jgi:predicted O-methyltransferase YrrM